MFALFHFVCFRETSALLCDVINSPYGPKGSDTIFSTKFSFLYQEFLDDAFSRLSSWPKANYFPSSSLNFLFCKFGLLFLSLSLRVWCPRPTECILVLGSSVRFWPWRQSSRPLLLGSHHIQCMPHSGGSLITSYELIYSKGKQNGLQGHPVPLLIQFLNVPHWRETTRLTDRLQHFLCWDSQSLPKTHIHLWKLSFVESSSLYSAEGFAQSQQALQEVHSQPWSPGFPLYVGVGVCVCGVIFR